MWKTRSDPSSPKWGTDSRRRLSGNPPIPCQHGGRFPDLGGESLDHWHSKLPQTHTHLSTAKTREDSNHHGIGLVLGPSLERGCPCFCLANADPHVCLPTNAAPRLEVPMPFRRQGTAVAETGSALVVVISVIETLLVQKSQ